MPVTSNILQRTFHIRCGNNSGTCFTVDLDRKRYLATAKHIANHIREQGTVEILHDGHWKSLSVLLVGHGMGDVDVSVLTSEQLFGGSGSLLITSEMALSDDVYFLGFPFGMGCNVGTLNIDFPLPFVKKAIISAVGMADKNLILLDGHNNPGFSGGPVVLSKAPDRVIGVVSGYESEEQSVLDRVGNKSPYTYNTNTGIVRICASKHIKEIIQKNPIGADIN